MSDAFTDLGIEDFIKLMVTELQNQDPLNPTDNNQILQQMSQMQSISSTQKLNTTLDSVLLGQNLSNAGSLIGKTVVGLTDKGDDVTGKVDSVTVLSGVPRLVIGDDSIALSNVRLILPTEATDTTGDGETTDTGAIDPAGDTSGA